MSAEQSTKEKKDGWDKLNVIASALIPAAIALAGLFYSNAMKKAEDAANELKTRKEEEVATINAQVNQAHLLSTFMEPLLSTDTLKQSIAMNAILIGVPVQGKQIVELIARSKNKGTIQQLASAALMSRQTELIKTLFSTDKTARINAASELTTTWIRDKGTIQEIISNINGAYANPSLYPDPSDGIYNCFIVLQNAEITVLSSFRDEIKSIVTRIPADNAKTKNAGQQVINKLN